ncbi:MAG: tetratricopeptide repeat protein [Prevotella sp.]
MSKYGDYALSDQLDTQETLLSNMIEYWKNDAKDPILDQISKDLTRNIADLVSEYTSRTMNTEDSCYLLMLNKMADKKGDNWDWLVVRRKLESLSSEEAVVCLDFNGRDEEKYLRIVDEHFEYQKRLFNHIVCLGLLDKNEVTQIQELLLTPTVDSSDQQIIVTALSLAGCRAFDIRKFELMINVSLYSTDEKVRQRALVGVVMTMGYRMYEVYPEQKDMLDKLLADETIASQLVELQIQLIYCVKAIEDSNAMCKDLMPNVIKASPFKLDKNGLVEVEEDPMDDILGKNTVEQRVEEAERVISKIKNMHKEGADIFYSGFSSMKRMAFFDDMVNWFIPFNVCHKEVRKVAGTESERDILNTLAHQEAMCDSDRYSFVFVVISMIKNMSPKIKEILTVRNDEIQSDSVQSPTYYRRNYLQSLFRFFKLFKWKNGFLSPFEISEDDISLKMSYKPLYFFAANPIFSTTVWYRDEMPKILLFMSKNIPNSIGRQLLYFPIPEVDNYEWYLASFRFEQKIWESEDSPNSLAFLTKAHSCRPDSLLVLKLLGKHYICYDDCNRGLAYLAEYRKIDKNNPQVNFYFALANFKCKRYDDALTVLYELEYKYPENKSVKDLLGVVLFIKGELSRAYDILTQGDIDNDYTDIYQYAYVISFWVKYKSANRTLKLVEEKKLPMGEFHIQNIANDGLFLDILLSNGICEAEVHLFLDVLQERS